MYVVASVVVGTVALVGAEEGIRCFGPPEVVCVKAEAASFEVGSEKRWPTVLGVGPAKSGSTITADILEWSERVIVGSMPCCKGETYFLVKRELYSKGPKAYAEFFAAPRAQAKSVVAYYDKTPEYSVDFLVPFRARAFLGSNVKLILTMRNPVDMDASQYFHFKVPEGGTMYHNWVASRIEAHTHLDDCRRRAFANFVYKNGDNGVSAQDFDRLYDSSKFAVDATARVEELLHQQCAHRLTHKFILHGHLYGSLLERWAHVFPNKNNFLCIANEDLVEKPVQSMGALYDFVGLHGIPVEASGSTLDHNRSLHKLVEATKPLIASRELSDSENGGLPDHGSLVALVLKAQNDLLAYLRSRTPCSHVRLLESYCGFVPPYAHLIRCLN